METLPAETFERRAEFLRHVYLTRFEGRDGLGELARRLQEDSLRWSTLRNRESYAWPKILARWGLNAGALMAAWSLWNEEEK